MKTEYPYDGEIAIQLKPQVEHQQIPLRLHIPVWCVSPELSVDGKPVDLSKCTEKGYAVLDRTWRKDSKLVLRLPMTPTVLAGRDSNAGKVAVTYGPLVFAADGLLNPAMNSFSGISLASSDIRPDGSSQGPGRTFHLVATAKSSSGSPIPLLLTPSRSRDEMARVGTRSG